MSAKIIDGKTIANAVHEDIIKRIQSFKTLHKITPCLSVVLVGSDPASEIYVNKKHQACEKVGMQSRSIVMPSDCRQDDLIDTIESLNADPEVHGILVQLPLPSTLDESTILDKIAPLKDVDGFHPYNVGRLVQRQPLLRPCTPFGIMKLLDSINTNYHGLEALIVGASNIVGRPMAMELLLAGATVHICHRFSKHLAEHVAKAELIIAAAGKPGLIKGEWIKPGAIVIDVGINRLEDGSITGDVEYLTAAERAAWITPVPGGVGPMTVAMLLENTLQAALLQIQ